MTPLTDEAARAIAEPIVNEYASRFQALSTWNDPWAREEGQARWLDLVKAGYAAATPRALTDLTDADFSYFRELVHVGAVVEWSDLREDRREDYRNAFRAIAARVGGGGVDAHKRLEENRDYWRNIASGYATDLEGRDEWITALKARAEKAAQALAEAEKRGARKAGEKALGYLAGSDWIEYRAWLSTEYPAPEPPRVVRTMRLACGDVVVCEGERLRREYPSGGSVTGCHTSQWELLLHDTDTIMDRNRLEGFVAVGAA